MESASTVDSTRYLVCTIQNLSLPSPTPSRSLIRLQHVSAGLELSAVSEVRLQIWEKTKNVLANVEIRNILARIRGRLARHKPAQQNCFLKRTSDGSSFITYI